jgi:hypothetical protein
MEKSGKPPDEKDSKMNNEESPAENNKTASKDRLFK